MRVLAACSLGGAGHLQPLLPFLGAAQRRGDETLVIGPPGLKEMVERTGWSFRSGDEPPEEEVAPIRERLPLVAPLEASVLGNRELFARLATTAMLPSMERTCRQWRPGMVVREPCEYASAIVAFRHRIPVAQVAISLAQVEAASIAVAAPALEEHRQGLVEEVVAAPYLTRFPASLDPSPFPITVRFREPSPPAPRPLPEWWNGSKSPLVYVTFGTVLGYMSMAAGVYRSALRAIDGLPVRALLTVGRKFDRSTLGPIPANVRVEDWVDQADVLPHADVVVCHGGSGTAFGAMAAGVPVVVVPLFADQFDNGSRIAEAGAGLVVHPPAHNTGGVRRVIAQEDAPRLAQGIGTVLSTISYRRQARRIAREIAEAPTVDEVLDALMSGGVQRTS
jgi:UDP:flavonoid glycosyltransferase YjiC (YdhE family)